MDKKTFFIALFAAFAFISLAVNGILVFTIVKNQEVSQQHQVNKKVLDFRNMFTNDILLSDKEVDFDTRLSLETAVRALNDPEILAQWQAFVNSQTKEDATSEAKKMLALLIQKTQN
jgi:hypothetical protein